MTLLRRRHRGADAAGRALRRMAAPAAAAAARRDRADAGGRRRSAGAAPAAAGTARAGLPALRGGLQPRRDRAHAVAGAAVASDGCSSGARRPMCPVATQPGTLADLLRNARTHGGRPAAGDRLRRPGWRSCGPRRWPSRPPCCCCGCCRRCWSGGSTGRCARQRAALSAAQIVFLRRLARRTWASSRLHVGAADHHLPPDNVQEHPVARIAHRTSPTNMGFALLADAGGARLRLPRHAASCWRALDATLTTMERMRAVPRPLLQLVRHADAAAAAPALRLDGRQRQPRRATAHPARRRCWPLADEPLLPAAWREGVHDTFGVLRESLAADPRRTTRRCATRCVRFSRTLLARPRASAASRCATGARCCDALERARCRSAARSAPRPPATPPPPADADGAAGRDAAALGPPAAGPVPRRPRRTARARPRRAAWHARVGRHADPAAAGRRRRRPRPAVEAARQARARGCSRSTTSPDAPARWPKLDHGFLYDDARHLMTIGYNVDERRADTGYYDLLASEARLGVLRRDRARADRRRRAGSRSAACSPRPPARRCCCRGAARCSST